MPEIVLTDEQARVLAEADGAVTVRDPAGRPVGSLDPADAKAIQRHLARKASGAPEPTFTSEQVHRHMAALQAERDRLGDKFDRAAMLRLLDQLAAVDPPTIRPDPSR
ncbi:MAG: hypothetical protein U0871_16970 [Gemmataceae bacterium]